MGYHILLAYDGTPQAAAAADWINEHFPDAEVTVLTVLDPMEGFLDTFGYGSQQYDIWREEAKQQAEDLLADARSHLDEEAAVETVSRTGQVPQTIVEYAQEHEVDHIVVGSHGRQGVSRILLGSVAEEVVRRSPTPVSVIR